MATDANPWGAMEGQSGPSRSDLPLANRRGLAHPKVAGLLGATF